MDDYFKKLLDNIELTSNQKEDAKTKYNWVCETVHWYFYENEYDWKTKYLFGSYKKKTNIRPIIPEQDVDVLIKLPEEIYNQYDSHEWNWQSELIRKIKNILKDTYTTTDGIKWWWKVILIEFSDWTHNIELLPAFEKEDWTFIIPNTSDWGSWESFDPRKEIKEFFDSNSETWWLTCKLSKIIKKWSREVTSFTVKSYKLEEFVIAFLWQYDYNIQSYHTIVKNFFEYLLDNIDDDNYSYVETALNRAKKATQFIEEEKYESAVDEWKKIFWSEFPSSSSVYNEIKKIIRSEKEQFIEDLFEVKINNSYQFSIDCRVEIDWFRTNLLSFFIANKTRLWKKKSLEFIIDKCNIPEPYEIKWKVRNFWSEAEENWQLRWEIVKDDWRERKKETTSYRWDHIVECYVIKNNICVARSQIKVPIN